MSRTNVPQYIVLLTNYLKINQKKFQAHKGNDRDVDGHKERSKIDLPGE